MHYIPIVNPDAKNPEGVRNFLAHYEKRWLYLAIAALVWGVMSVALLLLMSRLKADLGDRLALGLVLGGLCPLGAWLVMGKMNSDSKRLRAVGAVLEVPSQSNLIEFYREASRLIDQLPTAGQARERRTLFLNMRMLRGQEAWLDELTLPKDAGEFDAAVDGITARIRAELTALREQLPPPKD